MRRKPAHTRAFLVTATLALLVRANKVAVGSQTTLRDWLEYFFVRFVLGMLSLLPRATARHIGAYLSSALGRRLRSLHRTGERNLHIAFPEMTSSEVSMVLRKMFRNLGWLLAEFAHMPHYSGEFAQCELMRYDGLEHYDTAMRRGKGVLVLTGHLGAWELSSFTHSLLGRPMSMVIRKLDNPLVDAYVNKTRCLHGNRVIHKDNFARGLLRAMNRGEAVGILMDTNMTPPQGVFVPFFGKSACTASGMARIATASGAAVIPGFMFWHEDEQKYVLHFGAPLELVHTGNADADAVANTALFACVTEQYIRKYPDQWLWLHRRWKTRPVGESGIY